MFRQGYIELLYEGLVFRQGDLELLYSDLVSKERDLEQLYPLFGVLELLYKTDLELLYKTKVIKYFVHHCNIDGFPKYFVTPLKLKRLIEQCKYISVNMSV